MITVDSRSGLVTDLRQTVLYGRLHVAFADLASTTGFGLPLGNPTVSGASWDDPEEARRKALGEAVERYCGHLVPVDRLVEATWHDLAPEAVDPDSLALHSKAQLDRPGFPFTGLRRTDRTSWVLGTGSDGTSVWVPAALVWLAPPVSGPLVTLPVSAGIAAGPGLMAARAAALAEVVERHAMATAWMSGHRFAEPLDAWLPDVPAVRLRAYSVPNLIGAPVVACVAEDAGGLVGVGCAFVPNCDDPAGTAAGKAAAEALQSLDTTAQLAAGGLPEWERPAGPLVSHRADRAFASGYRTDFVDVTDVTCHLQLLADPAFAAKVLARFEVSEPPDSRSPGPFVRDATLAAQGRPGPFVRDAALAAQGRPGPFDLDAALAARGLMPVTIDLTTEDVAAHGLRVVRVVVPGLRATTPAAFPMLGDGAEPLPPDPDLLPVPHA